jgi:DNA-binding CsgD family transcriptional regulator
MTSLLWTPPTTTNPTEPAPHERTVGAFRMLAWPDGFWAIANAESGDWVVAAVVKTDDLAQAQRVVEGIGPAIALGQLSQRERDVVEQLLGGLRLSAIAKKLGISQHTARNHLKHVFRKTGTHSQIELLSMLGGRRG